MDIKEFDVHFSLSGFYRIDAKTEQEAQDIAALWLKDITRKVEDENHVVLNFDNEDFDVQEI